MNEKRRCIDSLKGIGILGVVLVHWGLDSGNDLVNGVVFNGARGVQLLFIINAFLIFDSLSHIEWNRENILIWYKRKFLRLIPLYWFFTIMYVILIDTKGTYYLGPLSKVSWLNVLCNMFFVHGFYPYYTNSINGNWFMGVLSLFYLLAPLIYKAVDSMEKAMIVILGISPAGFLLRHILLTRNVLEYEAIWADYVNIISFLSELPIILLGVLVYHTYKVNEKCDHIRSKKVFSIVSILFVAIGMLSLILNKGYFMVFNNIFSFGILLAILVFSQLVYPLILFDNKFFALIGRHSYGIYLSHMILMNYMKLCWRPTGIYQQMMGYCIIVLIALVIAAISEKLIEEKLMRRMRRFFG